MSAKAPQRPTPKSGFSAWLDQGNNKELAIGGAVVLALALYARLKGSSSSTAANATTAADTGQAAVSAPATEAEVNQLADELGQLDEEVMTLQTNSGAFSSEPPSSPSNPVGPGDPNPPKPPRLPVRPGPKPPPDGRPPIVTPAGGRPTQ